MSSQSVLAFANQSIFEYNYYSEEILTLLFQPNEYIVGNIKKQNNDSFYETRDGYNEFRGFVQSVKVCKKRLEIFGISERKAKIDFKNAKKISNQESYSIHLGNDFTYAKYISEINDIIESRRNNKAEQKTKYSDYLISEDLGIIGQSLDCHLYSILSVLDENEIIEYDLTDVINGGWVYEEDVKSFNHEKIIILTEGKTDAEFISESIKKLYPYLKKYYHFIDFDEFKVESNASALVKLVISLSAANIKHPIIALFDNDTAGIAEMLKLEKISNPNNIKILKMPNTILGKKYPTIGPTGKKNMNINGLASGIEMYLGKNVLTKNGSLIPIRWKSFDERYSKYQGVISEKNYVHDEFRKKLKSDKLGDMVEMNELLGEIFNAFK